MNTRIRHCADELMNAAEIRQVTQIEVYILQLCPTSSPLKHLSKFSMSLARSIRVKV
jgi:hypothetical protein